MANPQFDIELFCDTDLGPGDDFAGFTNTIQFNDFGALRLQDGVSLTSGRQNETGAVGAGTLVFTLNNSSGDFTPDNTAGAYYPGWGLRKCIRFSWIDSDLSGTANLFTGYITEIQEGWNNGKQPFVRVVATDRIGLLNERTMKALTVEEQLYDEPVLFYPLNDSQGSTTAGDQSVYRRQGLAVGTVGTGGTAVFGHASDLGADPDTPCLVLTRSDASNGKYLTQSYADLTELNAATGVTLECYAYLPVAVSGTVRILELSKPLSTDILALDFVDNIPVAKVTIGSTVTATASGGAINDGAWHHVAAWYDGTDVKVYVDGADTSAAAALGTLTSTVLSVGGTNTGTTLANAWLSGVAVYDSALTDARMVQHGLGVTGATGETTRDRFNRIVRLAVGAWSESGEDQPTTTMCAQPFAGQSAATLLQVVADAEIAPIYCNGLGQLVWSARSSRSSDAAPITVASTQVDSSTGFSTSLALVVNEATVERPGGAKVTASDTASIAANGRISESMTLYYDTDAQVSKAAAYIVNTRSEPRVRMGALSTDIVTSGVDPDILLGPGAHVGNILSVTNMPRGSGTQVDVFIEGITDYITPNSWRRTFNTSPLGIGGQVWVLGNANFSVLGSTTIVAY